MEQKIQKTFFVFHIIAFELEVATFDNIEQDTWQYWTGYLKLAVNVLTNTIKISSNTRGEILQISFRQNDEKHYKGAVMEILEVFCTISHVYDWRSVFSNTAF